MFGSFKKKPGEKELQLAKENLVKVTDENIRLLQDNIDRAAKILKDFKKSKYPNHDSFFNLCLFSDIVSIDLSLLLEKLRLADRKEERKLYARVIALTIVDFLDNISVLMGRDCLKELENNKMTQFTADFKEISKKFSNFKKDNDKLLRNIRNNTIAHKSKDALKLNDEIERLNEEEIFEFGLEFKVYAKEFSDLATRVVYFIVDYMKEAIRK